MKANSGHFDVRKERAMVGREITPLPAERGIGVKTETGGGAGVRVVPSCLRVLEAVSKLGLSVSADFPAYT